jgi:serine/threonine-protein kinase
MQDPPAEQPADEGSTVTITVGKSPKQVPVPNVVGMDVSEARTAIEAVHLTVGIVTPQTSATAPVDEVIGQDPPVDTLVNPGTPVNLVVSSGPTTATVPDVICFSFGKAKSTLAAAGFGIELAGEMPADPLCPNGNRIVQQDPAANGQANQGTVVQVWVGTEASPSPSSTP